MPCSDMRGLRWGRKASLLCHLLLASRTASTLLRTRHPRIPHTRVSAQLTAVEPPESLEATQMGNLPPLGEVLEPLAADQIVPDEWNPETAPFLRPF